MSVQVPASDNGGAAAQVADEVFGKEYNEGLVHQVVVAIWLRPGPAPRRKRPAPTLAAVALSPGSRRLRPRSRGHQP